MLANSPPPPTLVCGWNTIPRTSPWMGSNKRVSSISVLCKMLRFSCHPKAEASFQRLPGAARAQPCNRLLPRETKGALLPPPTLTAYSTAIFNKLKFYPFNLLSSFVKNKLHLFHLLFMCTYIMTNRTIGEMLKSKPVSYYQQIHVMHNNNIFK